MNTLSYRWLASLAVLTAPLHAQDPEPSPPPADADEESSLLGALLDEFDSPGHDLEYGSQDSFLVLHGFLDLVYLETDGGPASFDLHHANLLLDVAVNQVTDARVEFEWEHGSQSTEMDQVFLDFHPFEEGPSFVLGRFYAPFGVDRRVWYPPASMTASRPLAFREVVPGNWYETGAMVVWERELGPGELGVETAVTNGLGAALPASPRTARQNRDANQNKMLSGRLGYRHESGVEAGVSFANGKHDLAGSQSYSYLGADLQAGLGPVQLVGEWVTSEVDDPASPGRSLGRGGWYLQAYLPLRGGEADGHALGAYLRADSVDPNDDLRDSGDRDALSLGLRWIPAPHLTFKAEFMKVDHDHAGPHPSGDEIRLQAVLDF